MTISTKISFPLFTLTIVLVFYNALATLTNNLKKALWHGYLNLNFVNVPSPREICKQMSEFPQSLYNNLILSLDPSYLSLPN